MRENEDGKTVAAMDVLVPRVRCLCLKTKVGILGNNEDKTLRMAFPLAEKCTLSHDDKKKKCNPQTTRKRYGLPY